LLPPTTGFLVTAKTKLSRKTCPTFVVEFAVTANEPGTVYGMKFGHVTVTV